jgi:hypothetical protein
MATQQPATIPALGRTLKPVGYVESSASSWLVSRVLQQKQSRTRKVINLNNSQQFFTVVF